MPDATSFEAPYRSVFFDTLGSTNQEGLARARQGDPGRLWIRANVQTEGRGRIGRPWSSPPGNLYASLMLVDPSASRDLPQLGFVAGVALARAVRRQPGIPEAVRLKWPNDLVCRGAKLAGILIEGCPRPDGAFACVIGFGVNCVSHPTGLAYPTTDLAEVAGYDVRAEDLHAALVTEMAAALGAWDRGRDFSAVREAWLGLALAPGEPLTVKTRHSRTDGFFETIDDFGRLMLSTPSGTMSVDAADVFLSRPEQAASAPH